MTFDIRRGDLAKQRDGLRVLLLRQHPERVLGFAPDDLAHPVEHLAPGRRDEKLLAPPHVRVGTTLEQPVRDQLLVLPLGLAIAQ